MSTVFQDRPRSIADLDAMRLARALNPCQPAGEFWTKYERARLGAPVLVASQRIESLVHALRPRDDWRALLYFESGIVKYGEAFLVAEKIKQQLRKRYAALAKSVSYERMVAESDEFWAGYEEVNRIWLPSDPVYNISKAGYTASTTASAWQLLCGASAQLRVLESYMGGEATVSTILRFVVQRSAIGTGTTPSNVCTINKYNTRSPTSTSSAYGGDGNTSVNWGTTQESLSGSPLISHTFNAFGGTDRWVSAPGEEIFQVNGEYLSGRSASGTPIVSGHLIWEEL